MKNRFADLFPHRKPIIAMAHVPPLPGTPLYNAEKGIKGMIASMRSDLEILLDADFDAVMFCNEGDRPYTFQAGYEGVAVMTHIVTELAPQDRPFGVDFLWDAQAALNIAAATGASFIREVATGTYESDMGLWNTDAAQLLRDRRRLDAEHVAIFMNIAPEFASPLGNRTIAQVARSVAVSSLADVLLVSGPMAGAEPNVSALLEAKSSAADETPVLVNTGTKAENIAAFLEVADGAIVGSYLKQDGYTWNPVEPERVSRFLAAAGR